MAQLFDSSSDQQEIQNMLDNLYPILNDPNQKYNLANFFKNNNYDPYVVNNTWQWSITEGGGSLADTACNGIANNADTYPCTKALYIGDKSKAPVLTLSSITVRGLSSVVSARPTVAADAVTITQTLNFSTISPYTPVTFSGDFTIDLTCCCSTDQKTCLPSTSAPYQGKGTFVATIPDPKHAPATGTASCSITIVFKITQLSPGVLTLQAKSVTLAVPDQSGNPGMPNISVAIQITSAGNQETFNNLAEEALNSAESLSTILVNANTELSSQDELTRFSGLVTGEVDDYLKGNHLYPFNNPSASVY